MAAKDTHRFVRHYHDPKRRCAGEGCTRNLRYKAKSAHCGRCLAAASKRLGAGAVGTAFLSGRFKDAQLVDVLALLAQTAGRAAIERAGNKDDAAKALGVDVETLEALTVDGVDTTPVLAKLLKEQGRHG